MSFRPIIDLWKSRAELADELQIPRVTVQQWWTRDSIPPERFREIVKAAQKKGLRSITEQALMDALVARASRQSVEAPSVAPETAGGA
jgi:hypothetical protein